MVFLAFTAAFVARRDMNGGGWVSLHKPPILWVNTGFLLASSLVLERARRTLRSGNRVQFNRWWTAGTVLGILFLAGQAWAWRQLEAAGLYMASSLSASFFYNLTATHAVHLVGGLAALIYVDIGALRFRLGPSKRTAIDVSAVFWHFLDVLWLYLLVVLYVWA